MNDSKVMRNIYPDTGPWASMAGTTGRRRMDSRAWRGYRPHMSEQQKIFYYLAGNEYRAGVKTVSAHVDILSRNNFDAAVLLGPRDKAEPVPDIDPAAACRLEGMGLCPGDTAVTLDGAPLPDVDGIETVRTGTLIKNPLMVFQHTCAEDWDTRRFDLVLCASEEAAEFSEKVLGVQKPVVVPPTVDPAVHRPLRKRNLIVCTDGASVETRFVKHSFLSQNRQHRDMEWVDPVSMSDEEIAQALGEAAVFLHIPSGGVSRISPLEAMACGCLVVGFRSFEAEDYAGPGNGIWCRDNELLECAQLLEPACALTKSRHVTLERLINSGLETASARPPRIAEAALVRAFRSSW